MAALIGPESIDFDESTNADVDLSVDLELIDFLRRAATYSSAVTDIIDPTALSLRELRGRDVLEFLILTSDLANAVLDSLLKPKTLPIPPVRYPQPSEALQVALVNLSARMLLRADRQPDAREFANTIDRIAKQKYGFADSVRALTEAVNICVREMRDMIAETSRDKSFSTALVSTPPTRYGDHLGKLVEVLNDMIGVDLSDADLGDAPLVGLLWSSKTVWPPGWVDLIREQSEQLGQDLWRIVDDRRARAQLMV
ncbi:hypothetical protein GCM10010171_22790 [Actinokineospora fastidiosa]|uniref:Uncharacterized protein n=1 Tax=Actinokineospora fastidiosa TaxID=1816 RepID=A0A918GBT9_9PSEU|nr:hypothetical protein GCM10010171_22790 [Actinokineospora fastidiosa]